MSARSSSRRYTAASSAGASPTSRFSASAGTNPFSSSSSRAAEYFAAQPPQEARSVSFTLPVSIGTTVLPRSWSGECSPALFRPQRRNSSFLFPFVTRQRRPGPPLPIRGERDPQGVPRAVDSPDERRALPRSAGHRRLVGDRARDRTRAGRGRLRADARVAQAGEGRGGRRGARRVRRRSRRRERGGLRAARARAPRTARAARRPRQLRGHRHRRPAGEADAEADRPAAERQPARPPARDAGGDPAAAGEQGPDRQPRVDRGHRRNTRPLGLRRDEGRRHRADADA